MSAFTVHAGVCAPILEDNVDTDQIIPSREMKRVSKHGLGEGLFAGWRYRFDGTDKIGVNADFVLNQPAYENASILLSGRNFGCGSSREHAVWALRDFGIRVIIAESFGRIFRANCARNRLLAVKVSAEAVEAINAAVTADPQVNTVRVDLEQKTIAVSEADPIAFDVDDFDRSMLLNGLDYIDFSMQYIGALDDFQERDKVIRPWAYL